MKRLTKVMVGTLLMLAPATAAVAAAAPATAAPATPAPAASCYASGGTLYCGNAYNANIYAAPRYTKPGGNPETVVDHLLTTFSWFDCFSYGQRHGGGNTVWYHTQGDVNHQYGWVAAVNVWTSVDPFPGVRQC
jgi:hypothetical protein